METINASDKVHSTHSVQYWGRYLDDKSYFNQSLSTTDRGAKTQLDNRFANNVALGATKRPIKQL